MIPTMWETGKGERRLDKKKKEVKCTGKMEICPEAEKKNPGIGGGIQIKKHPPIALGSQQ